ncbi:hypothetical protein MKK84_18820 [Methylobacterium sp. E-065]|uniref:hypothetical protein n=1 Tax=Methylobacterium sp. E-065 TaxID=2836583 RepID=UPI001FB8F4E5|nr:hypothetical protein [Methylobacterium sp. E-065]MCJ2019465.1 hypothetical protein [Methylobacterium sp. E-065]
MRLFRSLAALLCLMPAVAWAESGAKLPPFNGSTPFQSTGGTTPRSAADRAADTVNVADVGVAAAFSATNVGKKIIVPPGTWTLASTARVPDGSVVEFLGRNAVIAYTGTGAALEIRSSKNVRIDNLNVDLTGANPAAEALHVYGAWYLDIFHPRVVMNGANQAGIVLETSQSSSQGYGTYMIEVVNPQFTGTGLYGLRTFQTSGDTRAVTHLNVRGGWSKGISYGLYLNYVSTGRVDGWAADTGIDAINIQNSNDLILMPGELGPGTGYGVNFGAGNAGIAMLAPSHAGVGGSLGYMNTSTFTPVLFDQSKTRLYASRSNQAYFIELGVNLQYNSTSGYLNFQGGNVGGIYQGIGFTQNSPVATGAFQFGEPTRVNDVVLGRNTTAPGDTAGFVQMPSISGPATAAPLRAPNRTV